MRPRDLGLLFDCAFAFMQTEVRSCTVRLGSVSVDTGLPTVRQVGTEYMMYSTVHHVGRYVRTV